MDATCQRCHLDKESTNHLLFQCPYSTLTWRLSSSSFSDQQIASNTLEENVGHLLRKFDSTVSKEMKHLPFWVCCQISKARNDLTFNKNSREPEEVVQRACDDVEEWLNATNSSHDNSASTDRNSPSEVQRLELPPTGYVKVNVDGSYLESNSYI